MFSVQLDIEGTWNTHLHFYIIDECSTKFGEEGSYPIVATLATRGGQPITITYLTNMVL